MRVSDLDYVLPECLIAQEPLADRSGSRLMVVSRGDGSVSHRTFHDLPALLQAGDLLVLNDTRVSAVRIFGHKRSGGRVEALVMTSKGGGVFDCLLKPSSRVRAGTEVVFDGGLVGVVVEGGGDGVRRIRFSPADAARLPEVGGAPLPPYIHLALAAKERYQTVYSRNEGSAAAPTAGLHFTRETFAALAAKGVEVAYVTLHVGIDTFRPMAVDAAEEHTMHGEWCSVGEETARKVASCRGRVIAVGTTSARTLESTALAPRSIQPSTINTRLFITPGYDWRVVDALLTNFHLPRTTMLLMLASMVGEGAVRRAYAEAVQQGYRFLSFGDAMLVL